MHYCHLLIDSASAGIWVSTLHTKEEKFGRNLILYSSPERGQSLSEVYHLLPRERMTPKSHDLKLEAS